MKSIAIFNNKGGVGKTTLLCNVASYLCVKKAKRVLVVDADPQCNASLYMLNNEEWQDILNDYNDNSIYKIFEPIQKGEGYIDSQKIPIFKSNGFGLDLVVGDTKLSVMEDFLSGDWISGKSGDSRGLKTTFIILDLLNKVKDKYDYVFFDVGPSLGAINRVVLLACNYFILPMSSDIFSIQALSNISTALNTWLRSINRGLDEYKEKEKRPFYINDVEILPKLKLLGYIYQQYTAKSVGGVRRPVMAYEKILHDMPSKIETELHDMIDNISPEELNLGSIPNFNSLIPMSQTANKPIFLLAGTDGIVGAHFSKVKEYENVMDNIVSNLLHNINKYD
ncbi:MAG: AAA family ATPase [Bacteroidales bacterium]|nr:AAA family ATPase [Bacteroidales bacterium]